MAAARRAEQVVPAGWRVYHRTDGCLDLCVADVRPEDPDRGAATARALGYSPDARGGNRWRGWDRAGAEPAASASSALAPTAPTPQGPTRRPAANPAGAGAHRGR